MIFPDEAQRIFSQGFKFESLIERVSRWANERLEKKLL
jgi:hypothetical protein